MALRPFWRGYLKLALVTCPVALSPAVSERDRVRFRTINDATGNPVRSRYVDPETGKEVDDDDQVKGYPVGKDHYVQLNDEELRAVRLDAVNVLDIGRFVKRSEIGDQWLELPYFLTPDDPVGEEAYIVIREAMASAGTVGLSTWVRSSRERPVMLQPNGKGIVLWTMRMQDELRDLNEVFSGIPDTKTSPDLRKAAEALITEKTGKWDRKLLHDPRQEQLLKVIEAKKAGRKPQRRASPSTGPAAPRTANIFEALKKSLAEAKRK